MSVDARKPVLVSGIQPTGRLTVGNWAGAIRHWLALQDRYECLLFLADLHALTVRQDAAQLRERSYEFLALYLACGIDPGKCTLFVQSHVPAHAELAWVLGCFARMGELGRMTQFKEKAPRQRAGAGAGLFMYPALMAADILLYRADLVPVGEDQTQHLELARTLARRFNRAFGPVFTVPEAYVPPVGARIRSLLDASAKMSKTDANPNAYVALLDEPDTVRRKIRRAVTDPGREVVYDQSKPGVSNLVELHAAVTGEAIEAIVDRYQGKGYATLKADLAERLIERLRPIQARYGAIRADEASLGGLLARGAEAAVERSRPVLQEAHRVVGLIPA